MSNVSGLGEVKQRFANAAVAKKVVTVLMVGALSLGALAFWAASGEFDSGSVMTMVGGGVAIIGLLTLWLVSALRSMPRTVTIRAHGIEVDSGKTTQSYRWAQLKAINFDATYDDAEIAKVVLFKMTIVVDSGETFTVTQDFGAQVLALADAICVATLPTMAAEVVRSWRTGEAVSFGALRFDDHGLHIEGGLITWDTIAELRIRPGELSLISSAGDRTFSLRQLPNGHVATWLVDQILTTARNTGGGSIPNSRQLVGKELFG